MTSIQFGTYVPRANTKEETKRKVYLRTIDEETGKILSVYYYTKGEYEIINGLKLLKEKETYDNLTI